TGPSGCSPYSWKYSSWMQSFHASFPHPGSGGKPVFFVVTNAPPLRGSGDRFLRRPLSPGWHCGLHSNPTTVGQAAFFRKLFFVNVQLSYFLLTSEYMPWVGLRREVNTGLSKSS